jgi:hypothetical protein
MSTRLQLISRAAHALGKLVGGIPVQTLSEAVDRARSSEAFTGFAGRAFLRV